MMTSSINSSMMLLLPSDQTRLSSLRLTSVYTVAAPDAAKVLNPAGTLVLVLVAVSSDLAPLKTLPGQLLEHLC